MKFLTEPKIYCIGRTIVDDEEVNRFFKEENIPNNSINFYDEKSCDLLPEIAGRVCYMSFEKPRPGGNVVYLDHIKSIGHGSVLEHSSITLLLTGVSRSLTHELVRHRAGCAYSQLSQRYVDEGDCNFVIPPRYLQSDAVKMLGNWKDGVRIAHSIYCQHVAEFMSIPVIAKCSNCEGSGLQNEETGASCLVCNSLGTIKAPKTTQIKMAREAARSVLPNCTETKIVVTGNGRAWRHMLEMRGALGADREIARLYLAILPKLQEVAPNLFSDYKVVGGEIVTEWRKV